MSKSEIITIVISAFGLVISFITFILELCTRKKVRKLTSLEIEKLEKEKERQSNAIVHGYIEDYCFVITNSGGAHATNVRCEGWEDWDEALFLDTIAPGSSCKIDLYLTKDSPSQCCFTVVWDDESGKEHVWKQTLNVF